jgi:hypothetical protein
LGRRGPFTISPVTCRWLGNRWCWLQPANCGLTQKRSFSNTNANGQPVDLLTVINRFLSRAIAPACSLDHAATVRSTPGARAPARMRPVAFEPKRVTAHDCKHARRMDELQLRQGPSDRNTAHAQAYVDFVFLFEICEQFDIYFSDIFHINNL